MYKQLKGIIPDLNKMSWWAGIIFVFGIALSAVYLSGLSPVRHIGLGSMALAILIGILFGNTLFPHIAHQCALGVDYAKSTLLRLGIILFGFNISFQQILGVGWQAILIDVLMVISTFILAVFLGKYVFKLDHELTMLIGAGGAICGAAAIVAAEPVIRAQPYKVTIAVATVVVFGTLSMFLYPFLYPNLSLSEVEFGIYAGSTIHEVAQVIAVGNNISETSEQYAVIVKMVRVMLLVPFLLVLSYYVNRKGAPFVGEQRAPILVPWFAIFFVFASLINSLGILPPDMRILLTTLASLFLASAMSALGLRTRISAIKETGMKPLLLAPILTLFLIVGGYVVNIAIL